MSEALTRLIALAPPPADRGHGTRWAGRTDLPRDYLEVVRAYGAGAFCDFLWLLAPDEPNVNLDIDAERTTQLSMLRESSAQGEDVPAALFDEDAVVVPWAVSDNGDVVWSVRAGGHERPRVYVCAVRPMEWAVFEVSCAEFLVAFVSGSLPDDVLLPGLGEPRFSSWSP